MRCSNFISKIASFNTEVATMYNVYLRGLLRLDLLLPVLSLSTALKIPFIPLCQLNQSVV